MSMMDADDRRRVRLVVHIQRRRSALLAKINMAAINFRVLLTVSQRTQVIIILLKEKRALLSKKKII